MLVILRTYASDMYGNMVIVFDRFALKVIPVWMRINVICYYVFTGGRTDLETQPASDRKDAATSCRWKKASSEGCQNGVEVKNSGIQEGF